MTESMPHTPLSADPNLHALLEEVAAGRLDPDVAVRRLHGDPTPLGAQAQSAQGQASHPAATPPGEPPEPERGFQRGVRVVPPSPEQPSGEVTRVVVSVMAGMLVAVG